MGAHSSFSPFAHPELFHIEGYGEKKKKEIV